MTWFSFVIQYGWPLCSSEERPLKLTYVLISLCWSVRVVIFFQTIPLLSLLSEKLSIPDVDIMKDVCAAFSEAASRPDNEEVVHLPYFIWWKKVYLVHSGWYDSSSRLSHHFIFLTFTLSHSSIYHCSFWRIEGFHWQLVLQLWSFENTALWLLSLTRKVKW